MRDFSRQLERDKAGAAQEGLPAFMQYRAQRHAADHLNDKMLSMNSHIEGARFRQPAESLGKPSQSALSKKKHAQVLKSRLKQLQQYFPTELE